MSLYDTAILQLATRGQCSLCFRKFAKAWKPCPVKAGTVQQRSCPESKAERKSPKHRRQAHILEPAPASCMASHASGGYFKGHTPSLTHGRAEAPYCTTTVGSFVKDGFVLNNRGDRIEACMALCTPGWIHRRACLG